jgi:hypothetical protein
MEKKEGCGTVERIPQLVIAGVGQRQSWSTSRHREAHLASCHRLSRNLCGKRRMFDR